MWALQLSMNELKGSDEQIDTSTLLKNCDFLLKKVLDHDPQPIPSVAAIEAAEQAISDENYASSSLKQCHFEENKTVLPK